MIQFIIAGTNGRDDKVTLWRTGEYMYLLEVGKNKLRFYETDYFEAIEFFNVAIANYQEEAV